MDEVCANCECLLAEDCCGGAGAYVLDDIAYCCEECAVDGECTCGCIANPVPAAAGGEGAAMPGPQM